ncbi:MAG TPA: hypothetical protein VNO81_08925 [Candidatus Nitrosotenuis sp.]|jgi:hypothetical protein|nr:hypothetical protein [Candidatus Nitrosotenuis sp.]
MVTDPLPRSPSAREVYLRSDRLQALDLPPAGPLRALARDLEAAMACGQRAAVEEACNSLAALVARHHGVAPPPVKILGVRPHRTANGVCVYEKFGDYDLGTGRIRLWMRTAMRRQVTSYGTLLSTLAHEICHHLDVVALGFGDTPHTRGFYDRAALLYHQARGTPLRRLVWVAQRDGTFRLDWSRTMRGG